MFRTLIGLIAVLAGDTSAVGIPRVSAVGYPPGERLLVHGAIDDDLASELIPRLSRARYLHIFSEGGEVAAAVRIAREVRRHRVTVVVDGRCASACAQVIAVSGSELRVGPRGRLLFHNSPWVWRRGLENNPHITTPALVASTKLDMEVSSELYQIIGFDTRLFACTDEALEIDYSFATTNPGIAGRPGRAYMRSRFLAEPSLELLSRAGVKVVRWEGVVKDAPTRAPLPDPPIAKLDVKDCPAVGSPVNRD